MQRQLPCQVDAVTDTLLKPRRARGRRWRILLAYALALRRRIDSCSPFETI